MENIEQANGPLIVSVDDFNLIHRAIHKAITPHGYRHETFLSAKDCIRNVSDLQPDLIISDIEMPDMNGLDFIDMLQNFKETRSIPVIFLSALFTPEIKKQAEDLGAAAYITKPFTSQVLISIVKQILQIHIILSRARKQEFITIDS